MKLEVSHGNISVISGYTFDIIQKGDDTEKLIQHFNQLEELPFTGNSTHHVGIYDFTIRLRQWKVQNVKQTIDLIEKDNSNLIYKYLFPELKKFVTEMKITLWEPDFLPFNYIFLNVNFDDKILESHDSYGWLRMSLLPIIEYWRITDGQITYKGELRFPMYYQIFYKSDVVKSTLDSVYKDLEKQSKTTLNVKKYVASCDKLKKYFLLEGFDRLHNIISLLKIQDDYFFLGNMGQMNLDLFNVFSLEPDTYKFAGTNPFFFGIFDGWPFPRLFLLYLLSATPHIWIDVNRTKLKEILTEAKKLKIKYRTTTQIDSEESIDNLLTFKNQLNYLLSDLNEIKNVMKIFKSYILDNPEIKEISIVVNTDDKPVDENSAKIKIKSTYIHILNQEFESRAQDIEDYVDEINTNLEFLQERIEPLQQKLSRKSNSKLSKFMLFLSIVTSSFAVIVGIDVASRWANP